MPPRSKPLRREQTYGSFIVQLWTGQTGRFHDMPRAQAWAQERLHGQPPGAYAAFYRAPVARGHGATGHPFTEPFHVLVVNEYGRIRVAGHEDWPDIPPRGAPATEAPRRPRRTSPAGGPNIPPVITHANMRPLLDAISAEPSFQPGKHMLPRPAWLSQEVVLEFPLGELARDGLTTMALVGFNRPQQMDLTGREGFDAQGLEGKIQIRKPLFNALMNLRDILPPHRGRILTGERT
jgi:hypothetical protein